MLHKEFCGGVNERTALLGGELGREQSLQDRGCCLGGASDVYTLKRLALSERDCHCRKRQNKNRQQLEQKNNYLYYQVYLLLTV